MCADGTQIGGLSKVALPIGPTPTESTFDVPVTTTLVATTLLIQAAPHFIDTGQQNTVVYGDTNGDGLADFAIRLTGSHVVLVATDFLL